MYYDRLKFVIVGDWRKYLRLNIDMFNFSLISYLYLFYILNSTDVTSTTADTKVKIINPLQTGSFF